MGCVWRPQTDASAFRPAVQPFLTNQRSANSGQRLFCVYLPGAGSTLLAGVLAAEESERQMLFEALSRSGSFDVLMFDRDYPAARLVANLAEHHLRNIVIRLRECGRAGASNPKDYHHARCKAFFRLTPVKRRPPGLCLPRYAPY